MTSYIPHGAKCGHGDVFFLRCDVSYPSSFGSILMPTDGSRPLPARAPLQKKTTPYRFSSSSWLNPNLLLSKTCPCKILSKRCWIRAGTAIPLNVRPWNAVVRSFRVGHSHRHFWLLKFTTSPLSRDRRLGLINMNKVGAGGRRITM